MRGQRDDVELTPRAVTRRGCVETYPWALYIPVLPPSVSPLFSLPRRCDRRYDVRRSLGGGGVAARIHASGGIDFVECGGISSVAGGAGAGTAGRDNGGTHKCVDVICGCETRSISTSCWSEIVSRYTSSTSCWSPFVPTYTSASASVLDGKAGIGGGGVVVDSDFFLYQTWSLPTAAGLSWCTVCCYHATVTAMEI